MEQEGEARSVSSPSLSWLLKLPSITCSLWEMLFSRILLLILQNLGENKLFLVDATEPVLKRKYIALQKEVLVLDIPGRLQFAE